MKQEHLKKQYSNALSNNETSNQITPLVLIQLPNSVAGEEKKESVLKF